MVQPKVGAYRYRWTILVVLWVTYVVVFLHRLSIGPLAPFLKEDLGLTSAQVGSIMSAAAFGYMLSTIPAGWGCDKLGVRWMLVIGEVSGGIFIMAMFLTPSYTVALILMALAGMGCGCLMPSTTKGVLDWFPLKERATVMGLKQTAVNIGGIVTAATLPTVALALGWRFGFLFLGIIAMVIGAVAFILYREPPLPATSSSDEVAAIPMGQALRGLLRTRDIWMAYLYVTTLMVVEMAVIAHLILYLTEALRFSVIAAGGILAMTEAGGALGKPGGGFISDRLFGGSRRNLLILWGGIACAICILVAFFGSVLSWGLYPALFVFGVTAIGFGGLHLTLVAELAGKEIAGTAAGINGVAAMIGNILGPILFGYIVDRSGSYQLAWLLMAIFAAIGVLAMLLVREERRRL